MLLAGVGEGLWALICTVSPECLSGLRGVGVPPSQTVCGWGYQLSWSVSHPSTRVCLQAESAVPPLLKQLREVLCLWGRLEP